MAHSGLTASFGQELLDGGRTPDQGLVTQYVEMVGQDPEQRFDLGDPVESLDPEGDLDQHLGQLVGFLADGPAAVGGLAPGGPVEAGVDPDPGRALLTGQAVGGLEAHVSEEHVHLEALLDRLALQQRGLEGVPVGGDELGEDVVQHGGAEATVLPCPPPPRRPGRPRGRSAGSSPTPIREEHGRRPRPPSTPSPPPSAPGPPGSSWTSTPPPTVGWWWATTPPSTAPPTVPAPSPSSPIPSCPGLDNAYWWAPGADVSPGLEPDRYPSGAGPRRTTGSASPSSRRYWRNSPGWCSTSTSSRPPRWWPRTRRPWPACSDGSAGSTT